MTVNPMKPRNPRQRLIKDILADHQLYLMLIPGILFILIFCYWPMWGVTFAFRDYSAVLGFGDWVGFEVFEKMFKRIQ